ITQFVWQTQGHTDNQFHVKVNHEYVVMYAKRQDAIELGYVIDPNTREESNLRKGVAENSITKNGPGNPASEIILPKGFPIAVEALSLPASEIPDGLIEAMKTKRPPTSNRLKAQFGKVQFPLRLDEMIGKDTSLQSRVAFSPDGQTPTSSKPSSKTGVKRSTMMMDSRCNSI